LRHTMREKLKRHSSNAANVRLLFKVRAGDKDVIPAKREIKKKEKGEGGWRYAINLGSVTPLKESSDCFNRTRGGVLTPRAEGWGPKTSRKEVW